MKLLRSAIVLFLLIFCQKLAYARQGNDVLGLAQRWVEAQQQSFSLKIRANEQEFEQLSSQLDALQEKQSVLALCGRCEAKYQAIQQQIEGLAQKKNQIAESIKTAATELERLATPQAYFESDAYSKALQGWLSTRQEDQVKQSQQLLAALESGQLLSRKLEGHLPEGLSVNTLPSLLSWVGTHVNDLPSDVSEQVGPLVLDLEKSMQELQGMSNLFGSWELDQIRSFDVADIKGQVEKALSAVAMDDASKLMGIADADNPVAATVVELKEKLPVKDRLFAEGDLVAVKGQGIAAISSLVGMKLSDRISVGVGGLLPTKELEGVSVAKLIPEANFLTRYSLFDGKASIDLEQVIPADGFELDKIKAYQRLGGRLRIPTGKDNPLVMSIMRTLNSQEGVESLGRSLWQVGMGMSF